MLPSDQVRYRGRYRVRYTPSLHFALHPHCNGSQVVENIGALHVTLQCVAVRCVTPPSIGGVTQQRNATVAEATGAVQPGAMRYGWVVPAWPMLGLQPVGHLVQLGGYAPQAPVLALAPAPPPPTPSGHVLKTARFVLRPRSVPAVGHYHLTVCDQSSAIFLLLFQEAFAVASLALAPAPWPRVWPPPGPGGRGLFCRWWRLIAMADKPFYVNFATQCFQSLTCFRDGANKRRKPKLLIAKGLIEQRKGERS